MDRTSSQPAPAAPPAPPGRAALSPPRIPVAVWLGLALLAASVAGVALALSSRASDGSATGAVASSPGHSDREEAIGHVDAEQGVAALYPLQPGLVVHIAARENEEVEAGAPLLQLDDTVAQAQVREAEADLKSAKVQLADARTLPDRQNDKIAAQQALIEARRRELAAARARRDRAERLSRSQVASAEEARVASETVAALEAGIKAEEAQLRILQRAEPRRLIERAQLDVEARQARLKKAQFALKQCTLWAPYKGTVLRVLVHEGEALGSNPHEPAIYFCPSGPRIIRAEVEQEFAGRVAVGQRAHIQDDSTGGGSWTGRLRRISDWYAQRRSILLEPRQFNDVRTLECIVDLDPNQPPLRIGQRVRVLLEGPGSSGG